MRKLIVFIVSFWTVSLSAQYVHTNGKAIVKGNGDTLLIRAMGVGGWMVQEAE